MDDGGGSFSVHQAAFLATSKSQHLVAVLPRTARSTTATTRPLHLAPSLLAGIVVAAMIVIFSKVALVSDFFAQEKRKSDGQLGVLDELAGVSGAEHRHGFAIVGSTER